MSQRIFVSGAVLLVLAGCLVASGCGSAASSSSTVASRPASTTRRGVSGFGATVAAWNASHHRDAKYSGPVYDADPAVPTGDRYTGVLIEAGHVSGYDLHFKNEPVGRALATAAAELPFDAKRVALVTKKTCAFALFRSRALGRALAGRPVGDGVGAALVEFGSGPSDESYNPKSLNEALFSLGATKPSQIPAC